jgi:hypothetical protein
VTVTKVLSLVTVDLEMSRKLSNPEQEFDGQLVEAFVGQSARAEGGTVEGSGL